MEVLTAAALSNCQKLTDVLVSGTCRCLHFARRERMVPTTIAKIFIEVAGLLWFC